MADMNGNKIFAVDFDGTLSIGARWPETGAPNKYLFEELLEQKTHGARIILWTCRNGEHLKTAVEFCRANGLEFDAVNANLPELIEAYGGDTRKVNADYYVDDKNLEYFYAPGQSCESCKEIVRKGIREWLKGKSKTLI